MTRLFAFLAAFVAVASSAAQAADLPGVAPAYTPVYRPHIYNWTGLYFGGHVGADFLLDTATATTATTAPAAQPTGTQSSLSPFGLIGGAQVGANYQMGPWVIGAEGTFSWTNVTGTAIAPSVAPGFTVRNGSTVNWYATATARAGYAFNNVLLYAKGGGAWMSVNYTSDLLNPIGAVQESAASAGDTRTGWTAGAGAELGITEQLSARLEYDYLDFGSRAYAFAFPIAGVAAPAAIKSQTHIVTFGLNYRFNWDGGGPLAARY